MTSETPALQPDPAKQSGSISADGLRNAARDPGVMRRWAEQLQQYALPEPDHFVWHKVADLIPNLGDPITFSGAAVYLPLPTLYPRPEPGIVTLIDDPLGAVSLMDRLKRWIGP